MSGWWRVWRWRWSGSVGCLPVPKRCPVCGRLMTLPGRRFVEVGCAGVREVLICSVCVALGVEQSLRTAAVERGLACDEGGGNCD